MDIDRSNSSCNHQQKVYKIKSGDVIAMIIDFHNSEIKWSINGSEHSRERIARLKYRAGINLYVPGDAIKLV